MSYNICTYVVYLDGLIFVRIQSEYICMSLIDAGEVVAQRRLTFKAWEIP